MKRLTSIVLVFSILYLVISSNVFAQTSISSAQLDYSLPYPGILPDNPLYFLKTFRDRLFSFFISDPVKKSEFDLLTADKRLASSIELFDKGKKELSETTISKGLNYFEDSVRNIKIARKEGRALDLSLMSDLEQSSQKYQEVIRNMINQAKGKLGVNLNRDLDRANKLSKEVIEFKSNQQQKQ